MYDSADSSTTAANIAPKTNLQLESGTYLFGGIPVEFQYAFSTSNRDLPSNPETLTFQTNVPLSTDIYVLMQAGWGLAEYAGKTIGRIRLTMGNGVAYKLPLELGGNVRDWRRGDSSVAVTTISDSNASEVWRGTDPTGEGGMDLLRAKLPEEAVLATLAKIEVIDESKQNVSSLDPSLYVLGITVNTAWVANFDRVPAEGTQLAQELQAGQTMILTGSQFDLNGTQCATAAGKICVAIITATKPQTIQLNQLMPQNNWIGITDKYGADEILQAVQQGFWLYPNCGNGCSNASVLRFQDGTFSQQSDIPRP